MPIGQDNNSGIANEHIVSGTNEYVTKDSYPDNDTRHHDSKQHSMLDTIAQSMSLKAPYIIDSGD
jgi:hypothetical protein